MMVSEREEIQNWITSCALMGLRLGSISRPLGKAARRGVANDGN